MIAVLATLLLAAAGPPRQAQVLQATGKRAYLGAGADDGLKPGMHIALGRGGCTIERVAQHFATCTGDARAGDRFDLPARPAEPPVRKPAGPLSRKEVQRRRAALGALHPPLLEYAAPPMAAAPAYARKRARVQLSHATWATTRTGPWQEERADVWLHAPLAGPLRIDADATALRWSARAANARFLPADRWQLYVREAALTVAANPGARATLGRLRPVAPGAIAVDGASAGYRFAGGSELGLYAGALPDASTTAPGTDRLTAGAAWRVQAVPDGGGLLRYDGRASVVSFPNGDKRFEVETGGVVSFARAVDLMAGVRLAAGAFAPDAHIDALHFDLAARLGDRVRLNGGVRHQALPFPVDVLSSTGATPDSISAFSGGASRHADLGMSWDVVDHLQISASGGVATEAGSGRHRVFGGPELSLPGLWSGLLTLSGGYLEERGWIGGRSAWAQATLLPRAPFNALLRGSWSLDRRGDAPGSVREVGVFASAGARLFRWLELRGSVLGRISPDGDGAGLAGSISAAGEF